MEGNKDEAFRCIDLARSAMNQGNIEKADKLLNKAERLYPSSQAKDLLSKLKSNHFQKPKPSEEGPRKRHNVHSEPKRKEEPKLNVDYTKEQMDAVNRIKKCKDFYEILGVTKEATDSEIKKAYKKLALQLHPDKNKSPGSVEAFKTLGNAASILTDAQKRKQYDLYGGSSDTFNSANGYSNHSHHHENAYQRFESDISAEEFFNMFFGGSGFPQPRYNRPGMNNRNHYHSAHEQQTPNPGKVFGVILLLILISTLSTFFQSDPLYSLQPSSKYNTERRTMLHKIPYYVKENFISDYQGSLGRLENSVEEEYIVGMKRACYNERIYREGMMSRAKSFGSRTQYQNAQQMKMPSCDSLYKLGIGKVNY